MKRKTMMWYVSGGVLLIAGLWIGFAVKAKRDARIEYREVKPQIGNLELTIVSTGTVNPESRLDIKPPVSGRMDEVLVRPGDKVKKGQRLAWMSSTERAALLDAAGSRGPEEVSRWEELFRATPIIAPIDGTIIQRNVEPGQSFANSEAVLVMSDRLTVKALVDETDISLIKLKQRATIVLDAYPRDPIDAHVDQIAFDSKLVNNVTTYVVDVLPKRTPDFMRAGMTSNVTFLLEDRRNVLILPNDALKTTANDDMAVFIKVPGQEDPVERIVHVGLNDGKRSEILDGLTPEDVVLVPIPKADKPINTSSPFSPFGGKAPGRARK